MTTPLRLLLSRHTIEAFAPEIETAVQSRPVELVEFGSPAVDRGIDAAFISRDVTGVSTKQEPTQTLRAWQAALLASTELRWVHTHAAGADRPLYSQLRARQVQVTTSSGAVAQVVAQTAIAGLLSLARHFPQLAKAQQTRTWAPLVTQAAPRDLAGQTAVIVGWGPIGYHMSVLLRVLGLKVVVVRNSPQPAGEDIETVTLDALHPVLPRADWLLLACPLTDKTRHLIGQRELAAMPEQARLVNIARGDVVVEAALIEALQSGRLAGAYLDVFSHEPLPSPSPLWAMDNVIVTPHAAAHSDGNERRVAQIFVDNLERWVESRPLRNVFAPG